MSKINVYSEYGKLKEVIIGRPMEEGDLNFEWGPGMDEEFSWMTKENLETLMSNSGKPWTNAFSERVKAATEQLEGFKKTLENEGIIVHQVPKLVNEDQKYINIGLEQVWPRDVWCTAGNTVVVSSLRMPWKRKQQFAMLPFYTDLMQKGEIKFLSTPQASTEILSANTKEAEKHSVLMDGGDFFVHRNEIFLGQGHGSNALGAKFAESIFGGEFKVTPVKLTKDALHLDCTISLIRDGLGIICREWLDDELPESIRDWTWIEATPEEAQMLGVNGFPIAPNRIIFDSYHERLIGEMRKHGVEVVDIPFDQVASWGGSLRCATQPVYREDI